MSGARILQVGGREVRLSNPDKVFFPGPGWTKGDLAAYYLAVCDALLAADRDRPTTLYRWPNGVGAPNDAFFQKRVPRGAPAWVRTATIRFPSGRSADLLVLSEPAAVLWAVNLGCIDLNPWPVRAGDVDHPDELRVDLDPTPGTPWQDVLRVAPVVRSLLAEHGLVAWVKTSGKRGLHIYAPIEPRYDFTTVRRAALALARAVERELPGIATSAWWKEERRGVFVDYNQNARDRTIASAYSVRPVADARVSAPVRWEELGSLDPATLRLDTVPERLRRHGDPWEAMASTRGTLDSLLELARRDEQEGLGDAPWPPHFPKGAAEPVRAAPSRRRRR